jgi:predicted lipoprotein with Yx(FWY)xxD motif
MKKLSLSLATILLLAVPALAQMGPAKTADTSKGKALVDAKGMTLYVFDKDAAGKSNCNGPCATNWPPLVATADAKASGDWSIVTRDDGGKQWAYKGKPLYTWSKDAKAGDVTGDGFNKRLAYRHALKEACFCPPACFPQGGRFAMRFIAVGEGKCAQSVGVR